MEAGIALQLLVIIIMIITTTIGNGTLCVCIAVTRELHSPSGYIVASLAVADLLVGVWLLPFSIPAVINENWTMGKTMCLVNGYTNHVLSVASLLGLFIISIDRYISIFYPLRYSEFMTSKRAVILIACQWGYAMLTAVTPLLGWGKYTFEKGIWLCMTDFRVSYSFSYFIILTVYAVPLTIMTVIYYRIFKIAFHHSRAIRQQEGVGYGANDARDSNRSSNSSATLNKWLAETSTMTVAVSPKLVRAEFVNNYDNGRNINLDRRETHGITANQRKRKQNSFKKEMRAGLVLFIIVVIFVISWSPFAILSLWALHTNNKTTLVSLAIVSRLAYFNSTINPPLYCLMNKIIRKAVKRVWYGIFKFLRVEKYFSCIEPEENEFTMYEMTGR